MITTGSETPSNLTGYSEMKRIVLISGRLCSGKSLLGKNLEQSFGFHHIKTSEILGKARTGTEASGRIALHQRGTEQDQGTEGRWVAAHIETLIRRASDAPRYIVVDGVRSREQIDAVRADYGSCVVHVHLTAPQEGLAMRYESRKRSGRERSLLRYIEADGLAVDDITALREDADLCIDTNRSDPGDTLVRVASHLRLYSTPSHKCVDVMVGGQYGSEGKGQIAGYLAKNYDVLVRVGGPNAGHKVRSQNGTVFTYHHLPSGCKDSGADVVIGAGAVVNPENLLGEIEACGLTPERVFIDPQAMTITEEDKEEEKRLVSSIGSTGQGVGLASARKITERWNGSTLARNDSRLAPFVNGTTTERLERAYRTNKKVFLEGTQGSALSIHHGIYPHVTSRDTNVAGCLAEAGISPARVRRILLVVRSYPIRVANPSDSNDSGYMKKEISFDEIADRSGLCAQDLKRAEKTSTTGRDRRVSEFDWELFRRSCALNAPTDIVLTFADYIDAKNQDAHRFDQLTPATIQFVEELERVANAPVSLISTRFGVRGVIDRRDWW